MIKLGNVDVYGWDAAIRGLRNPMNSWHKSDSYWDFPEHPDRFVIGEADLKLMRSLANAGDDHGKFLRMITVTVDIIAPLYWWKEFDTYKVGTVANSCSTMHKIHAKEFTLDDFSHEHLEPRAIGLLEDIVDALNIHRENFIENKDKHEWWQMIQLLPTSYNQRRTVQLNYQVLKHMYFARKAHKLDCWRDFCAWIETLPYFKEIVLNDNCS